MSWAGSDHWEIYLGAKAGGVARGGRSLAWRNYDSPESGLTALLEEISGDRGRWTKQKVRLWLSASLARPFLFEPPAGMKNSAEVQTLARARAGEATGLPARCEVWLSARRPGQGQLGVAVETETRDALLVAAHRAKVRLLTVRPWWAQALDEALLRQPDLALIAVADTEAVTLLAAKDDVWVAADSYDPKPPALQLESLVTRRLFAAGVAELQVCRVGLDAAELYDISSAWPRAVALRLFESA